MLPLVLLRFFLKLRNQVIRLIGQILNGRRQDLHRRDGGIVGLNFQINVMHQGVRVVVSRESDRRVSQQLHAKQVADGVIFLVEAKGPGVGDLGE